MNKPTTEQIEDLRHRLKATRPNAADRFDIPAWSERLIDATLAWVDSISASAEKRTAFGQPADPAKREGFVLNAVNTIDPAQVAAHGEDALLAWIRQTIRELAANGADPFKDVAIQVVGMEDGTIVITGEAGV